MTMTDATDTITHYRTEQPPEEPGWYWLEKKEDDSTPEAVKVLEVGDVLHADLSDHTPIVENVQGALWTGPIPGPESIAEEAPPLHVKSPDVYQQDVCDLLAACGLETHARPKSPHAIVQEEIIPQIKAAMSDSYTGLRDAARRAESLLTDLRQRRLPTQNDIWQALASLRQALSRHSPKPEEKEDAPEPKDTAFPSAPWDPERPDETGHAHVWGSDGDLVATVCGAPVHGETAYERARVIASVHRHSAALHNLIQEAKDAADALEAFGDDGDAGMLRLQIKDAERALGAVPSGDDEPTEDTRQWAKKTADELIKRADRISGLVRYRNGETHLTDADMHSVCSATLGPNEWDRAEMFDPDEHDCDEVVSRITCTECRTILDMARGEPDALDAARGG